MTPRPVTPIGILAARLDAVAPRYPELAEVTQLAAGLDPYLSACSTPESQDLHDLTARTQSEDWSATGVEQEMLSGHLEGQLLKMLVHLTRATRVLDIGMFTGYSALAMAEALPDDGCVIACELDPKVAAFARAAFARSAHGHKVDVRVAPAADTLATLDGPFDVVFLDADKAGYVDYLNAVLDRGLLSEHGVVCVDNTLMQGLPWAGEPTANSIAVAEFNRFVVADPRVEQVLLPLRDGVTLIRHAS
jgi:caffeoyl-CoA O-methyltransferase